MILSQTSGSRPRHSIWRLKLTSVSSPPMQGFATVMREAASSAPAIHSSCTACAGCRRSWRHPSPPERPPAPAAGRQRSARQRAITTNDGIACALNPPTNTNQISSLRDRRFELGRIAAVSPFMARKRCDGVVSQVPFFGVERTSAVSRRSVSRVIYLLGNSESSCSQTMPKAIRPAIQRIVATLGSRPIATKNHAGRKKLKNIIQAG
jgi:alkanesulfonate monooxygenase SsuD/methylene tetrahydromethanopterin reductase-like flavin-dependent oxidoreductase (luciferase family)